MAVDALTASDSATLDGLRGLAALIVVASHASLLGMNLLPAVPLAGTGKYGVYLFFVLSAFLLTAQWLQLPAAPVKSTLRHSGGYLLRRFARIYPLYLVVLLTGWALAPRGLGVPLDGAAVGRHLALAEGRDIYWSIPVEFVYYLVIPPLALALRGLGSAIAGAVGLIALVGVSLWLFPSGQAPLNSIALGYYLPIFLCGSAAAWWHCRVAASPRRAPSATAPLGLLDLLALALLAASVPAAIDAVSGIDRLDVLHRAFLPWGLFWSAVLLAALRGRLPLWQRVLQWLPLRRCGRWCFGIYLLHMPALYLVKKLPLALPPIVAGWLGLLIGVGVAALAFRFIERPVIRWAHRITTPAPGVPSARGPQVI